MVTFLNNSVTLPKEHHWYWLMLKKGGSFNTIKSFYCTCTKLEALIYLTFHSTIVSNRQIQAVLSKWDTQVPGAGQCYSPGSSLEKHSKEVTAEDGSANRGWETLSITPSLQRKATHRFGHFCILQGTQLLTKWQEHKNSGAADSWKISCHLLAWAMTRC